MDNIELFDFHCHLDLYKNYKQVALDANRSNALIIAVTNIPSVYEHEVQLFQDNPNVIVSLGLHPQLINSHGREVDLLIDKSTSTRFIGEIGLDYQDIKSDFKKEQQKIFKKILTEAAKLKDKVLSVHSRRASEDVVSMIGSNYPGTVVLHWYSGSLLTLKQALKNGYYFSINPTMVLTEKGQEIIKSLPLERILTETDGPFIKVNNDIATFSDISIVIDHLSALHKKRKIEIKKTIKANSVKIIHSK